MSLTSIVFSRTEDQRPQISEDNLSPLVQILAWLFLTFAILFVAAQFLTKWTLSRRPGRADAVLLAALVRKRPDHWFCTTLLMGQLYRF
jgi:hypothetical protein